MRILNSTTITLLATTITQSVNLETDNTVTSPPWSMQTNYNITIGTIAVAGGPTRVIPCRTRSLDIVYCDFNRSLIAACTSGVHVATVLEMSPAVVGVCQEEFPAGWNGTRGGESRVTTALDGIGNMTGAGGGTGSSSAVNTTANGSVVRTKIVTSVVRKEVGKP